MYFDHCTMLIHIHFLWGGSSFEKGCMTYMREVIIILHDGMYICMSMWWICKLLGSWIWKLVGSLRWSHMNIMACQIIGDSTVCSVVCSGYQQRLHQRALLAICEGNPLLPVDSPHKGPVMQRLFPCHHIWYKASWVTCNDPAEDEGQFPGRLSPWRRDEGPLISDVEWWHNGCWPGMIHGAGDLAQIKLLYGQ